VNDYHDPNLTLLVGDARKRLRDLSDRSVQTIVTSPPYFNLRSYGGGKAEIGKEASVDAYVAALVEVFREVRRVLRDDGTVWLNLGDCFAGDGETIGTGRGQIAADLPAYRKRDRHGGDLKPKDLIGVPWMVAFALRADGWYLRSDIVWAKGASGGPFVGNPMPESVRDRPSRAHEFVFLLSKRETYFYDHEAVKEELAAGSRKRLDQPTFATQTGGPKDYGRVAGGNANRSVRRALENLKAQGPAARRNRRDVWTITTKPFPGSHFATMPPALVEPCVLAGTSERGQCQQCGSPWLRVVSRDTSGRPEKGVTKFDAEPVRGRMKRLGGGADWYAYEGGEQAEGWRPTCAHYLRTGEWCDLPRRLRDESDRAYERRAAPVRSLRRELLDLWCDEPNAAQVVLDPFGGAGTTSLVAERLGRRSVLIELNPAYAELTLRRLGRRPVDDGLELAA
jgi:DNA modification methylase